MKTLYAIVLSSLLVGMGCTESAVTADAPAEASAETSSLHFIQASITGMDCGGCVSSVCSAANRVAGVSGSNANFSTGRFTAVLNVGTEPAVAVAEIEKLISGLNNGQYTVEKIEAVTAGGATLPDEAQQPTTGIATGDDA
ncbi:MAG: heavy metal-associated domain-containing protein [Planctomycetota bacterium]